MDVSSNYVLIYTFTKGGSHKRKESNHLGERMFTPSWKATEYLGVFCSMQNQFL